jgi:hypothetical protein
MTEGHDLISALFEPGKPARQPDLVSPLEVNEPGASFRMSLNKDSVLNTLHNQYQVHNKTIRTLCRDGHTNGAIEALLICNTYLDLYTTRAAHRDNIKTWSGSNVQWLRDMDRNIGYAIKEGLLIETAGGKKKAIGITAKGRAILNKYEPLFFELANKYEETARNSPRKRKAHGMPEHLKKRNFDAQHFQPAPVKPY